MVFVLFAIFLFFMVRKAAPAHRPFIMAAGTGLAILMVATLGMDHLLDFNPALLVGMGVPLFFIGVVNPTPAPDPTPTPVPVVDPTPAVLPYNVSYIFAIVIFIIETAITLIDGVYAAGNGAALGLTPQVHAWFAVIGPLLGAIAGILPAVPHTPARRLAEFARARMGLFPRDVRRAA